MTSTPTLAIALTPVAPGRWTTLAGQEWSNPGGGLWGGYAIGLCIRVLEAEPEVVGEALSLTLTYAAGLPSGDARHPHAAAAPGRLGRRVGGGGAAGRIGPGRRARHRHHGAAAEDPGLRLRQDARRPRLRRACRARRCPATRGTTARPPSSGAPWRAFRPTPSGDSRSLAWVRSRRGPLDKALLGMITDNSAPRAMYALGPTIMTTTLSLTAYLHATVEEIAEVGDDFILVECEGRVGGGGASDERSSYWRRDGKLLATSEQLAWYREVRRGSPE